MGKLSENEIKFVLHAASIISDAVANTMGDAILSAPDKLRSTVGFLAMALIEKRIEEIKIHTKLGTGVEATLKHLIDQMYAAGYVKAIKPEEKKAV